MMLLVSFLFAADVADAACPDVADQTKRAWAEYQSAELPAATALLVEAVDGLACQTEPLEAASLLELYWLSALVALSNDDAVKMRWALRRAVAADHTQRPPVAFGPELRSMWERMAAQASLVSVFVDGDLPAWVDGREIGPGASVQVATGLHVIQVSDGLEVSSRVVDLSMSETVSTGSIPEPDPPPPVARRARRPPVLFVATAVAGAASAFAIASGVRSERSFRQSRYNAVSYDFCRFDQSCYPIVRENAIRADAGRINAAYGVGYGLAAVTGGLLTLTISGLPERRREQ